MDSTLREEVHQMHARLCAALADTNRILILYSLADGPCNVTDLTNRLELPQPTVSRHLKVLRERNLVQARRQGQSMLYSLSDPRVLEALDLLRAVMAAQLKHHGALALSANKSIQSFE